MATLSGKHVRGDGSPLLGDILFTPIAAPSAVDSDVVCGPAWRQPTAEDGSWSTQIRAGHFKVEPPLTRGYTVVITTDDGDYQVPAAAATGLTMPPAPFVGDLVASTTPNATTLVAGKVLVDADPAGGGPATALTVASANVLVAQRVLCVQNFFGLGQIAEADLIPGALYRTTCNKNPGDQGGLTYRYDPLGTGVPNGGTIAAPGTNVGRFVATEWNGSVRSFGAQGDNTTDDTDAFQRAINYAQTFCGGQTVYVPAGLYIIDSIALTNSSLEGDGSHKGNAAQNKSVLIHKVGATGNLINLLPGPGHEFVRHLTLRGRREQNQRNPVAITAVQDRTHFSVSVANLPQNPASPGGWPFYGMAFFFSAEGRYMGNAVIQSINSGTGQCTVYGGWDNYATRTGTAQLLTPAEKVCFSPVITFAGFFQTYTDISDCTAAGWSAIRNEKGHNKNIEDVYISHFHCGIALGDCLCMEYRDVWTCYCSLAGIASIRLGVGADDHGSRVFLQGFYQRDLDLPAETTAFDNIAYRYTFCGMYGIRTRAVYEDITTDQTIIGLFDFSCFDWVITHALIDKPVKEAILSLAGSNFGRSVIRNLQVATFDATLTTPSPITYFSGARSVIGFLGGLGRMLDIGWLHVSRFGGSADATNDFARVFYVTSPSAVECRSFAGVSGYTTIWGAGGTGTLTLAQGTTLQRYNAASPVAKVDFAGGVALTSDATAFTTLSPGSIVFNPIGGISLNPTVNVSCKLNGYDAFLANLSGSDPFVGIRTSAPRRYFDVQSGIICFGADVADLRNRTASTGKSARFAAISYDMASDWNFLSAETQSANNVLQLGGNGIGGCPTQTDFYIGDSISASPVKTNVARMKLATSGTSSLSIHDSIALQQVRIGPANSGPGGVGRALYLP